MERSLLLAAALNCVTVQYRTRSVQHWQCRLHAQRQYTWYSHQLRPGFDSMPHSRMVKWRERHVTLDTSNSHPEPECWTNHLSLCAWHTIVSHRTSKSLYICLYIVIVQFFFTLICLFSCSFCIAVLSIWNSLPPFVHHVHNIHFKGGLVFLCWFCVICIS